MRYILLCIALVLAGCSTTKDLVYVNTVKYVQPHIAESLFESAKSVADPMTEEVFKTLTLSQRFTYFGEKIINLQSALDAANLQINKIHDVYLKNKQDIEKMNTEGGKR